MRTLLMVMAFALVCHAEAQTAPADSGEGVRPGAQTQPAPPPATRPSTPSDVLSGPTVSDEKNAEPTIVHKRFDGVLDEVGPEPDVAAIEALTLTDEQHKLFDQLLLERHSQLDQLVRANYALILELAAVQGETDEAKRRDIFVRAREAFQPYLLRGSFIDEFADHLNEEQRVQVNRMINEYREAKVNEVKRLNGLTQQQAVFRARIEVFGQMIRASIERQVLLERENLEYITKELDLTPEQRNKTEAIFGPLVVKRFQEKATPADRADAMRRFNQLLTPKQRLKLFGLLVRSWKLPETPATAPASTQPKQ